MRYTNIFKGRSHRIFLTVSISEFIECSSFSLTSFFDDSPTVILLHRIHTAQSPMNEQTGKAHEQIDNAQHSCDSIEFLLKGNLSVTKTIAKHLSFSWWMMFLSILNDHRPLVSQSLHGSRILVSLLSPTSGKARLSDLLLTVSGLDSGCWDCWLWFPPGLVLRRWNV